MTHSIQEPTGYKSKSLFNVIVNGKPLVRSVSYPKAYALARSNKGAIIKFASFSSAEVAA